MLKIGEFSKLSQLSIRMLRHYNDIGLLPPAVIDPSNGYRYYQPEQLTQVSLIRFFQALGLSLQEIKLLLPQCDDLPLLSQTLKARRASCSAQMTALQTQLQLLDTALTQLERNEFPMTYPVTIKNLPARQVASLRDHIDRYEDEGLLWQKLFSELSAQSLQQPAPPCCMALYHDQEYTEGRPDVEVQLAVTGQYTDTAHVHFKELPAMTVASVTFSGPYDQITPVNLAALKWCEANHYHFTDTMFSIYHVGPDSTTDPADYLTECCFPIAKDQDDRKSPHQRLK